jgi:mycofactocin system glycosyltransferase
MTGDVAHEPGIELDPGTRRVGGTVLVGGSPRRAVRLSPEGARVVDRLVRGEPVASTEATRRLVRRLTDHGLAHPRPAAAVHRAGDVGIVVPVRDQPDELADTLAAVAGHDQRVIVVDDGSRDRAAVDAAVRGRAELVRLDRSVGPGGARDVGWRRLDVPLIAFSDAGCHPDGGWVDRLLGHFADPSVAAVAPRIASAPRPGLPALLRRYEVARPTLDRGARQASVRPGGAVPFVPATFLLVRRQALAEIGGFDGQLRFGEDVDLVWRLLDAGHVVRYDPGVVVTHPTRTSAAEWLRQRYRYGTSAGRLGRKHPAALAPIGASPSVGAWSLVALGWPIAGTVAGGVATLRGARRVRPFAASRTDALSQALTAHVEAGLALGTALRRAWWPVAVVVAVAARRARRPLLAIALAPSVVEWLRRRPPMAPWSWLAAHLADDVAYSSGVWVGCLRERHAAALLPGRRWSDVRRRGVPAMRGHE